MGGLPLLRDFLLLINIICSGTDVYNYYRLMIRVVSFYHFWDLSIMTLQITCKINLIID